MQAFHKQSAQWQALSRDEIKRFVIACVRDIQEKVPELYDDLSKRARDYFHSLPDSVEEGKVTLTRQHGDLNAHNTLVQMHGGKLNNFAIIDWEDSVADQLPIYDLNHFFISNSKLLLPGASAQETFNKFILSPGWYQELYIKTVSEFSKCNLIDEGAFWRLTPLYLLGMCVKVHESGRQQGSTASVWLERTELFIERFPTLQA
jgi:hypothetical protein